MMQRKKVPRNRNPCPTVERGKYPGPEIGGGCDQEITRGKKDRKAEGQQQRPAQFLPPDPADKVILY